jgi:hypothetical protein
MKLTPGRYAPTGLAGFTGIGGRDHVERVATFTGMLNLPVITGNFIKMKNGVSNYFYANLFTRKSVLIKIRKKSLTAYYY